jgi:hypothetical protein
MQSGIACQNTTPYTPQQNGLFERMNKTFMDKEKSMFIGVGITQEFWAVVVDTTIYLVNMSSLSALVDMTPHEVCSGKNTLVSHMKAFGYEAFVYVPK